MPPDPRVKRFTEALQCPARTEIKRIDIIESDVFATQSIEFNRLTAIVGTHGSGKSALLGMLHAAFGQHLGGMLRPPIFGNGFASPSMSALLDVTVTQDGNEATVRVDLSENHRVLANRWREALDDLRAPIYTSPARMLDDLAFYTEGMDSARGINQFTEASFEKAKRHIHEYSPVGLDGLRRILGRSYNSVSVFDIDDMDIEGTPHIEAVLETNRRRIDNTRMSLGELWTHWLLGWETAFRDPGPLMVDEPESYLARRGHTALIDELVRLSLESETQTIVATHSAEVLLRFPLSHIRMCTPTNEGIIVTVPSDMGKVRDALGIENMLRLVVLVEDQLTATLVEHLCSLLDPSLIREIEILPAGGREGVVHGLKAVRASRRLRYLGVLSGSARGKVAAPVSGESNDTLDTITYLPGHEDPEDELMKTAYSYGRELAKALDRSEADVFAAANTSAYLDPGNRLMGFASAMDFSGIDLVLHAMVQIWLKKPGTVIHQTHLLLNELRKRV